MRFGPGATTSPLVAALNAARAELEAAALALGEKFHNEADASWEECQRYERAALMFYRAHAAQNGEMK